MTGGMGVRCSIRRRLERAIRGPKAAIDCTKATVSAGSLGTGWEWTFADSQSAHRIVFEIVDFDHGHVAYAAGTRHHVPIEFHRHR
jgi:hypothetical protein